jgi:cytochrome P450
MGGRMMSSNDDLAEAMAAGDIATNPQPVYEAMRTLAPVLPVDDTMVLVCRREEIDETFRRPDIFSSNMSAVDLQNVRPLIPLQIDPPDHKKYRKVLDPLFSPRQMAALEEPITALANDLIDRLEGRDEIDFVAEFSIPFPSQVFLTLLGLPLEDLPTFLAMKDGIIRPDHVTGTEPKSEAAVAHQRTTAQSIYDYFNQVLDDREGEPGDDLLTKFLHTEVDGHRLSREDILDISFLFLIAGLDTVSASLDCMFAYLAQHPEQRHRLARDREIIPRAVEELLRWETPVTGVTRIAMEDTTLSGCPIRKGQHVSILLGSANTDENEFGDAQVVRFERDPNRHLAFGGGIHRCLGSHLARQELRIALREWHRRIPDYSIRPGYTLSYTAGIRSIDHFPMVLGRR